jgi:cell division protease FtsH
MTDAHADARRILTENRHLLEAVTRRLLEVEVMEGDELRAILDGKSLDDQPVSDDAAAATIAPSAQSTA